MDGRARSRVARIWLHLLQGRHSRIYRDSELTGSLRARQALRTNHAGKVMRIAHSQRWHASKRRLFFSQSRLEGKPLLPSNKVYLVKQVLRNIRGESPEVLA